jgi:hypothetical protein
MSVKPVLLKDLRRTAISQHQQMKGTGNYNSFSPLVSRERTFSVGKRKLSGQDSNPAPNSDSNSAKIAKLDSSVIFDQLKGQESVLAEVKTSLAQLEAAPEDDAPAPVKAKLLLMTTALGLLLKSQENLTSVLVDVFNVRKETAQATLAHAPNKPANLPKATPPTPNPEAQAAKKVKQAIREAEKKTLLFNLNLGNTPAMNKDTLARKVTLALSSAASAGEHDYDIKDAEEVIDDILSCSKLEFLGTTSKKFYNKKNPADPRNDKMCTLPVRFEFRDRETRFQAESNLRKICKVSCAVPYPKRLRLIMDNLVREGKKLYPKSFIRTKVNVDTLTIDVHAKTGEGWTDLNMRTTIPTNICDGVTSEVTEVCLVSTQSSSQSQSNSQSSSNSDEAMSIS